MTEIFQGGDYIVNVPVRDESGALMNLTVPEIGNIHAYVSVNRDFFGIYQLFPSFSPADATLVINPNGTSVDILFSKNRTGAMDTGTMSVDVGVDILDVTVPPYPNDMRRYVYRAGAVANVLPSYARRNI